MREHGLGNNYKGQNCVNLGSGIIAQRRIVAWSQICPSRLPNFQIADLNATPACCTGLDCCVEQCRSTMVYVVLCSLACLAD